MSNLPMDIIINIISRLPVKSLGRLKSTCKFWNSLISSPWFVKLQHDRAISDADLESHFRLFMYTNPSYMLNYESPSSLVDLSGSVEVDLEKIRGKNNENLVGSCYGLIYFVCYQDCIIVWNPCTKKVKNLPNPPSCSSDDKYFYGLGYDRENPTCEYKMVRIIQSDSPHLTIVEVFNVQTSSLWRSIEAFDNDITILEELGTLGNGALHWKVSCGVGPDKDEMILSFNIRNETFGEISLPNLGDRSGSFWFLGELKGRLCLQVGGGGAGDDLDIWVMKEYGVVASWTKLVTYKWKDFCSDYGLSLVCFTKNGDSILNADNWDLVRFDSVEGRSQYFKKFSYDWFECFMFVESLVSPHGDNLVG